MIFNGQAVNKAAALVLYAGLVALTVWGGAKVYNYSLDSRFYKDYLSGWESAWRTYTQTRRSWPRFEGGNHVSYMETLIARWKSEGLIPPDSNTTRIYVYRINKLFQPQTDIFILCLRDRIVMYGAGRETFRRMDTYIDGRVNPHQGRFTGGRDGDQGYTGQWQP